MKKEELLTRAANGDVIIDRDLDVVYPIKKEKTDETDEKSFTIFKTDDDQHLVFGWASVSITVDGQILEDRQHDTIDPEDLEEAAYEYVLNFRDTGEEHMPGYRKKGKLVESCVFTAEKQKAMGIPEGVLPVAWWIGFKIDDEDTWRLVKNGTYKMFSIEGRAQREEIQKAESTARSFEEVLKFNPYHDQMGRFTNADGATSMTWKPGKGSMYDAAISREKDRTHRKDFHDAMVKMISRADTYNPQSLVNIGKEVAREINARFKAKKKSGETDLESPQTEDIYDVLKDIRSFGPPEDISFDIYSGLSEKRTQNIVKDALDRYPTDWYEEMAANNISCKVQLINDSGRSFHNKQIVSSIIGVYAKESPWLVNELKLKTDEIPDRGVANALTHELGHFFEAHNLSVGESARRYYEKRTKNSETIEMSPGEFSKPDRFADEYMGKVYESGSTEITSVLSQKLGYYNPEQAITTNILGGNKDRQSYNFILGLLAAGGTL